jgi:hypothetical protein
MAAGGILRPSPPAAAGFRPALSCSVRSMRPRLTGAFVPAARPTAVRSLPTHPASRAVPRVGRRVGRRVAAVATALRALSALVALPGWLAAQGAVEAPRPNVPTAPAPAPAWRVTLTAFRNPGTGLEVRRGALVLFAGHYPTVIRRDSVRGTTHFARVGAGLVVRPEATTAPYASLSWAVSASRGWPSSALVDAGVRQRLGREGLARRITGRLGAALLVAPNAPGGTAVRVNPTIGAGLDL